MNAKTIRPVRVYGPDCYVTLTRGLEAVVDAQDAELVGRHNWYAEPKAGRVPYARSDMRIKGKWTKAYLHRFLVSPEPGYVVDHIDGDGLNNRRSNLRVCLHKENMRNSVSRKANGLPKGVHPYLNGRYKAYIQADGVVHQLGFFDTVEEAAEAYRRAAEELHGLFARYR
jgi:hypothetical protein